MRLPHEETDVAREDFQFLEDLATAFWYSQVMFTALELDLCELLAKGPASAKDLTAVLGCDLEGLTRLLQALVSVGLIVENEGRFENAPLAARYLVQESKDYAGDFLRYRKYLASHWVRLTERILQGSRVGDRPVEEPWEAYQKRVFAYVRAMDQQARQKAYEAMGKFHQIFGIQPRRILDLGGGAGTWCRACLRLWPEAGAVLVDLPETLTAARELYPEPSQWQGIELVAGDVLNLCINRGQFDLVVLSNIIHAYGKVEVEQLLKEALLCLAPKGMILIHDYFLDEHSSCPHKGNLYDLHMMLNTYNGRIYSVDELKSMLNEAGLKSNSFFHLETDTSLLVASRDASNEKCLITHRHLLEVQAKVLGFKFARVIETGSVSIDPWVRLKCQFGCSLYGKSSTCPPFSPDEAKMKEILSTYEFALLVQGSPPSKVFHERLLALEKSLFLDGFWEVLAFGAGPCPVCAGCPSDGRCRFPEKARPSLEACGVDVYETSIRAGLRLKPIKHPQGYVKYVGLVLFKERNRCVFF